MMPDTPSHQAQEKEPGGSCQIDSDGVLVEEAGLPGMRFPAEQCADSENRDAGDQKRQSKEACQRQTGFEQKGGPGPRFREQRHGETQGDGIRDQRQGFPSQEQADVPDLFAGLRSLPGCLTRRQWTLSQRESPSALLNPLPPPQPGRQLSSRPALTEK